MPGTLLDRSLAAELVTDLSASGSATEPILAPFTGEVLHELPLSTAADVEDAASAARLAQLAWQRTGFAHRRKILLKAHDLLLANREQLLDLLQSETGKTRGQAFEELFNAASTLRYSALAARKVLRSRARRGGVPLVIRTRTGYTPKGLVGVITPWNFPLVLGIADIVPALAAGNAVVQKADNQAVLTILASRRALIDAGLPAALWAVVAGDGNEIGNAVVDAADYVAFTGSTATGRKVAQRAAANLTGVSLELGGKNPLIVLDDVNPRKAAISAAYACFSSLGQMCVSIERIYVMRAVSEPFTAALVERVRSLKGGANFDNSTDVGTLTSEAQLRRVQAHVADAVAKGATVLAGGKARPELGPYFFEPTVLTGVTGDMECFAEETFGPVVAVTVVDSEEEAIAAANASSYGLNASVFSRSLRRAHRVARSLEAGSVNINEGYRGTFSSVDAPMGGVKHSGLGRRNGPEGLLRFVDARTISHATGVVPLPHSGRDFARISPAFIAVLVALKAVRRR